MKLSFFVLKLCCLWSAINAQFHPQSPCPGIFSYEGSEPEQDHWYGVILVSTDEALVGVRLDIKFDRPAQLLVSWMGEVTSTNNERFTILSLTQKLLPGPPLSSRFMVKYDSARGSPQLRSIRLNGRQICPPDPNFPVSLSRPVVEKPTRRPDPAFEQNYNMGSRITSEPVIFDHQTSSTGDAIRTTRRPPYYGNEGSNNNENNFGNNGHLNNSSNGDSYYESPIYHKPQTTSTTTESYYNQGRPSQNNNNNNNNNYDNYNNKPSITTTTRKPSGYNSNSKPQNVNNEESNYSSSHSNTNNDNYNSNNNNNNNHNNNSGKNKNQTKPPYTQTSTSGYYNNNSGGNSNSKTTSSNQRTTSTTAKYTRTTQRQQTTQNNDYAGSRVNPTKNSNSNTNAITPYQPNYGRPTTPRNQNSGDPSGSTSLNSYDCGVVDNSITSDSASPVPLITNGQKTARGQWPWHIALYKIEGINLSYICGGTLVSLKVVITAAHCVTKKLLDRPVDPDSLVVYLGKYHLYQFSDDGGVQNKQVKDVFTYPGYNSSNFLGDIAVLILTSSVEYTSYVRPCCLWRFTTPVTGKEGTVVGWGYDENDRVTEELKMAKMPVVSHETCIYSYPDFFARFTSNQTFCAGFRKGTTVCNGDSGGGMVFNVDSKWYLRGLVSITVAREGHRVCDTNHYVIFTDVAEFLTWIDRFLT